MKSFLILVLAGLLGYLLYERMSFVPLQEPVEAPEPTPEPTPAPTPEPTPEPTPTPAPEPSPEPIPEPTPQVRLAPEGVYYVIRQFSVPIDGGLRGFPPGKEVTLVREEGSDLVVRDGDFEVRSARANFTNDLDVVDELRRQATADRLAKSEPPKQIVEEQAMRPDPRTEATNKRREAFVKRIERARLDLDHLERRISVARNERHDKGYPMDGGPRLYRDGIARSLSPDAAKIRQLINQRERLYYQIGEMELSFERFQRENEQ